MALANSDLEPATSDLMLRTEKHLASALCIGLSADYSGIDNFTNALVFGSPSTND